MFLQIELLYFIAMIVAFVVLLVFLKVSPGLSLMISAVIGALISGFGFPLRHLVEGSFGYIDVILIITTAMIFMQGLEESNTLKFVSLKIVEKFHKYPVLMLILFMLVIMFPGMITGSSLASIVSSGALLGPIMIKLGIPKAKVGAIIAFGAVLGMVAPPINVPVMVICDIVDMPYIGFTLPLLLLSFPLAIFVVLFFGYKHVKNFDFETLLNDPTFDDVHTIKWPVVIPVIILALLIVGMNVFPSIIGVLGLPLIFTISAILTLFFGKKPNAFEVARKGVYKSFGAMGLLMGVGMFVQIITLNGVRGYFVINAMSLPDALQIASLAITVPIFGGISAFGSASVLGGPFVMSMVAYNQIVVASGISLIASLGEFLPPTAMSATFAAKVVEEKNYLEITKKALIPWFIVLIYGLLFVTVVAQIWK